MHPPSARRRRGLGCSARGARSSLVASGRQRDLRQPDAARHRLDRGDRPARSTTCPSRRTAPTRSCSKSRAASSPTPPTRRPIDDTVKALRERARRRAAPSARSRARGKDALSKDEHDRLHLADARRRARRPRPRTRRRRSSTPPSPARDAGIDVSAGGYLGQAGLEADDPLERGRSGSSRRW